MPKLLNVDFSAITSVSSVSATTIQNVDNITYNDDGVNLLLGGSFKGYDDYDGCIVKLFTNGDKDVSFNSGTGFLNKFEDVDSFFPSISIIELDSNGDYYIGGRFNTYNGFPSKNIIKVLKTGEIDTSFDVSIGFNSQVRAIKIQSDGKILVIGDFTTYKGLPANKIIRLNPDGSVDTSFKSPSSNSTGTIIAIAQDSLENIYIGGTITEYSGFTVGRILKLTPNGDVDQTFNLDNGFNSGVFGITIDSSDNLYVCGAFTTYSGITANKIIKLLNNGVKDETFDNSIGFNDNTTNIVLDSFGKIYVIGFFTRYKNINNTKIVKLNSDGTIDTTFATNLFSAVGTWTINDLHIDSLNNIYIGGIFPTYASIVQSGIVKVNSFGALDPSFNSFGAITPFQTVNVVKTDSNGDLIVGGTFNSYKQPLGLASIRTYDAKKNTQFNPNYGIISVNLPGSTRVRTINKLPTTNNIYIGGGFQFYTLLNSTYTAVSILGLNSDGSPNPSINVNTGPNSSILNIFIDSVGGIYLVGVFTAYKGTNVPRFVKINPDASIDNSFNRNGLQNGSLYNTVDFDISNNIYLGGAFTTFSGQTNNRIIKLLPSGFKDDTFDNSIGFNNTVNHLKVDLNGKIVIVGSFTEYKGVTANRVIRLNPDGSIDNTFDNSIGFNDLPTRIEFWNDKIYIFGLFTTYKNVSANSLVRLNYDGSIDKTFRVKSGIVGIGNRNNILVDNNGSVYLLGSLINYQNYGNSSIVKIKSDGSRDVLFNVTADNFKTGLSRDIDTAIFI